MGKLSPEHLAWFVCRVCLRCPTLCFGRADIPTGTTPDAIASGDFNGDGNPALAVVNHDDGTVSIFFGKPDGTFDAGVDYLVGSGPIAIAVGDFNGDGKPNLAVVNQNCTNVYEQDLSRSC